MTGEQHERAVEAMTYLLDDSGLTHPQTGPPAAVVARDLVDAYHASLREQRVVLVEQPKCSECDGSGCIGVGHPEYDLDDCARCNGTGYVRLVDLREVVEFVRTIVALPPALIPDVLPDAIERRFGGNERSE